MCAIETLVSILHYRYNVSEYKTHWIRKSGIENLILPILYYPGRHCYVKVASSCEIAV